MKKIFFALVFMIVGLAFAEEKVLFDASAKAELDGYDYVSNFEITSDSGWFKKDQFKILEPNDRGIRFLATGVPKDTSTSYKILVSYPSFLNKEENGSGYIYNVKYIKSIKVEATTNRPYDEIILLYTTSPNGQIKKILMPQDFNSIKSMEDYELVFENPNYEADPKKREVKNAPVLGSDADGLYLVGFQIKTNSPSGMNAYSNYSAFYLRKITVVYDKMYTDEQIENNKQLREEFGIVQNTEAEKKAKAKISERNRLINNEKELMAE
jgi:hypothetical protein